MKKIFLIVLFSFYGVGLKAQTNLDSLYSIWQDETQTDSNRIYAYNVYVWNGFMNSNPDSAFKLAEELLTFGLVKNNLKAQSKAYNMQGVSWYNRANYTEAITYYFQSLKIEQELGNQLGIYYCLNNIGLIYESQGDYDKAFESYSKGLNICKEIDNLKGIADSYNNLGNIHIRQKNNSSALEFHKQSLKIREQIGDQNGIATSLNNIGLIYKREGNYSKTIEYYKRSLKIGEDIGDKVGVVFYLNNIGNLYLKLGNYPEAIDYCTRAYKRALIIGALDGQKNAYADLYRTYKAMGNGNKALEYHEKMGVLKDSLFNKENTKKLTQLEMQFEYDKKESAVRLEQEKKNAIATEELRRNKLIRNGFIGGFAVMLLFALIFFSQRNRIKAGKKQSDELLLNILPAEVAEELKAKGSADAQLIEQVSVLFTDFKGFTAMSEQLSAKDLVNELNLCFSEFDKITTKYEIEKIKTIGDAYMAAGGLPSPTPDHAKKVVLAALEMAAFVQEGKQNKQAHGLPFFEVRIGIHTGPVVAGIVGVKKFQYDIWGDTVNTASRMESSGEVGKVNISEATCELLKDDTEFAFESRGEIEAKGKGELAMYFVSKA